MPSWRERSREQAITAAQEAAEDRSRLPGRLFPSRLGPTPAGAYEEAVKALQQSKQINGNIAAVHFQLGVAQSGLNHLEDAVDEFTAAVELEPEHSAAHYALRAGTESVGPAQGGDPRATEARRNQSED